MGIHGQAKTNADGSIDVNVSTRVPSTTFTGGAVSVTTTATLIKALNTDRNALFIANNDTRTVFIGKDSSVTAANGFPLAKNDVIEFAGGDLFTGDIYGIIASGAAVDVRFIELED